VELLLGMGVRFSEPLSLRRGHISLNEGSAFVSVRHGKGGSTRARFHPAPARKALPEYMEANGGMSADDQLYMDKW